VNTIFQQFKRLAYDQRGAILLYIIAFGGMAFTIIVGGVVSYSLIEHRASIKKHSRDMAFHIAEAGIEYYRWHLAHDPNDFQDGTGQSGPYVHEYYDKDGTVIGDFSLEIDPPLSGSTIVTVRSTGHTAWDPDQERTVQVRVGFPALTDFAFVENSDMSFSQTTEVHGKVHSNGGIEFNGTTDAVVQSAQETYDNGSGSHSGVWGIGGPSVFFDFPVPPKDFFGITSDLADIRDLADEAGVHLSSSGDEGWHIEFLADGTFNLYLVITRLCYGGSGTWVWWWGWYWDGEVLCYDIDEETFQANYPIPENGAIFVEDDVWVSGVVNGRVTVGAGRFPVLASTYQDIYIPDNLVYEEKNSDDVLGLIAQGDIIVPRDVPDDMEIDAAALSQFNQIQRPYYNATYFPSVKNSLLFYGSQISYDGGGWKWIDENEDVISGFVNTNHTYDGNLRYYPPPGFPVENTYDLISWEEIE